MKQLSTLETNQISGGDGVNLTFVSINVPTPTLPPAIANLVTRLLNGQIEVSVFVEALSEAGGSLVQYMSIAPSCQGPFSGPIPPHCLSPFNPPAPALL